MAEKAIMLLRSTPHHLSETGSKQELLIGECVRIEAGEQQNNTTNVLRPRG